MGSPKSLNRHFFNGHDVKETHLKGTPMYGNPIFVKSTDIILGFSPYLLPRLERRIPPRPTGDALRALRAVPSAASGDCLS